MTSGTFIPRYDEIRFGQLMTESLGFICVFTSPLILHAVDTLADVRFVSSNRGHTLKLTAMMHVHASAGWETQLWLTRRGAGQPGSAIVSVPDLFSVFHHQTVPSNQA
jgi:hypothetical protein